MVNIPFATRPSPAGGRWNITIRQDLELIGQCFVFAEPQFIGRPFAIEDITIQSHPPVVPTGSGGVAQ